MTGETKTLAAEVELWLQECGSCDAALPMGCTCPQGDYRNILLKVWRAYEASRREVAEEIAQALLDFEANDIRGRADMSIDRAVAICREIGSKETR